MRMAVGSAADGDAALRTDGDRLRAVVLRQAFAGMLKPGPGGTRGLAQDSWRSMLAEAMADVAARAVDSGMKADSRGGAVKPTGPAPAREVAR